MARRKTDNAYTTHNEARLIRGGSGYFDLMVKMIDAARSVIHLQVYIFDENDTGKMVVDALIRAARRNVAVYTLVDGYASQRLSRQFIHNIRSSGVYFSFFKPFFKSRDFYFGRRLHHKVLVVDGAESLVAGANISDRYNDIGGQPAWLDWGLHASGEVSARLHTICTRRWNRSAFRKKCTLPSVSNTQHSNGECLIRPRINDWVNRKTEITRSYFELINNATSCLTIMSSYFWPSAAILRSIAKASARGVKVRLILAGVSDVSTSKYAERYLYRKLFRDNIDIYEYKENVLHGKMAVCDDKLVTIGSYNVNNISAYASIELNLEIKDTALAAHVTETFAEIITNHCRQITEPDFIHGNTLLQKLFQYIAYQSIHLAIFLSTFYFKQGGQR